MFKEHESYLEDNADKSDKSARKINMDIISEAGL